MDLKNSLKLEAPKCRSPETPEKHSSKVYQFERFLMLCGEVPRSPKSQRSEE
jgi:hypothetical protein